MTNDQCFYPASLQDQNGRTAARGTVQLYNAGLRGAFYPTPQFPIAPGILASVRSLKTAETTYHVQNVLMCQSLHVQGNPFPQIHCHFEVVYRSRLNATFA